MKDTYKDIPLVDNISDQRFELTIDGYTAIIEYKIIGDSIYLLHTETPEELGGKGVGAAIAEKAFSYIEEHHLKAVAYCPFIVAYLERHPEWKRILAGHNDLH